MSFFPVHCWHSMLARFSMCWAGGSPQRPVGENPTWKQGARCPWHLSYSMSLAHADQKLLLEEEAHLMASMICGPSAEDEYVQNSREWGALAEELEQSLNEMAAAASHIPPPSSVPSPSGESCEETAAVTALAETGGSSPHPPAVAEQNPQLSGSGPIHPSASQSSLATEGSADLGSVIIGTSMRQAKAAEDFRAAVAANEAAEARRRRLGQLASRGSGSAKGSPKPPAHSGLANAQQLRFSEPHLDERDDVRSTMVSSPGLSPVARTTSDPEVRMLIHMNSLPPLSPFSLLVRTWAAVATVKALQDFVVGHISVRHLFTRSSCNVHLSYVPHPCLNAIHSLLRPSAYLLRPLPYATALSSARHSSSLARLPVQTRC